MRALLVLLTGCDPEFTPLGDVVDANGRPIPDAQIVFACDVTVHAVLP